MSNLAKVLREIKERSALAPRDHKIVNRDQLDALRESPQDVVTLLNIVDNVLQCLADAKESYGDRGMEAVDGSEILWAMEDAVRPDLVLTEQQEDGILEV